MLGAVENGRWVWGTGGPSSGAYALTLLHLLVAVLCLWSGLRQRRPVDESELRIFPNSSSRFWIALGVVLFLLGVNQQADLHTLVSLSIKQLVLERGWFDHQWFLQVSFITIVLLNGGLGIVVFYRRIWKYSRWCYLAILGLCLQIVFVLIRAASLHYIDELLGLPISVLGGLTSNVALESIGLCLILIAAAGELYRIREVPEVEWEADELEEFV